METRRTSRSACRTSRPSKDFATNGMPPGRIGRLRVRRRHRSRAGVLDRHSPAHGLGVAARRTRVLLHADRHHRPLPAHAGQERLLPAGWDDNGLPTERRVQNYYGVTCDPSQPYDADFVPPAKPAKNSRDFERVSRQNFIELCERLSAEDEQVFEDLFRSTGLSVDWKYTYRTIDDTSRAVSQRAFLADLAGGHAYSQDAPTMWDVTFGTAVAQAELEDREKEGAYHKVKFFPQHRRPRRHLGRSDHHPHLTARAHPGRRRPRRPPRGRALPAVLRHHRRLPALRRRGRGQGPRAREVRQGHRHRHGLHLRRPHRRHVVARTRPADRAVVNRAGRLSLEVPEWISDSPKSDAVANYEQLAGKTTFTARKDIAEMLRDSGDLVGEIEAITHGAVLREGRQTARGRHLPPVVHPQRRSFCCAPR